MADKTEFDWGQVSGQATKRLRAPRVTPVPDAIIKLAQQSYDGLPDPDNPEASLHVMRHEFTDETVAKAFAKLLRRAGEHTTPQTSVTVVHDPDGNGNTKQVAWKAGARRGRTKAKSK